MTATQLDTRPLGAAILNLAIAIEALTSVVTEFSAALTAVDQSSPDTAVSYPFDARAGQTR